MWLESFSLLLTMLASAAAEGGPPAGPQPIHTRQAAFAIPFRMDRPSQAFQEPVEVQLHVSTDRSATWQLYSKVEPRQGAFRFRAGSDGEYWFLIRTLDRAGQLRPQGPPRPGLRVVVDTTPPKLQLEAGSAPGGRIAARWQLADECLNPGSLKIQYRTDQTQAWQAVAIDRQPAAGGEPVWSGSASWLPPPDAKRLEIRAEASDLAGNPAVSHAQIDLGSNRSSDAIAASRPAVDGRASRVVEGAASDWQPAKRPAAGPTAHWASTQPGAAATQPGSAAAPRDPVPAATPAAPNLADRRDAVDIQINPALRRQYALPASQAAGTLDPGVPPGVRPRMVNTRVFELDYGVDAVGSSGIAKVELWGTRDRGRTWASFGVDADKESPILVTVNEDGLYGFCVSVQNGVGLGGGPPQSGQTPDVWIGVDRTKPEVRILSAQQGAAEQAGKLLIRWEARDWMLAAQPISLLYSDSPGGPWTPIVAGVDNLGQYHWTVDDRVPTQIYLRVEARDEAGNLGICETPKPVLLDRLRPSVHIRDVRPVGQSPRESPPQRLPR